MECDEGGVCLDDDPAGGAEDADVASEDLSNNNGANQK